MRRITVIVFSVACSAACHAGLAPKLPVMDAELLWQDSDRHPFEPKPADNAPTRLADHTDQLFLRPISQFFEVRPGREAINVNALDEVANSSWFTNRIGVLPMTPDEVASGPCIDPPFDTEAPITVESSKLNGVTPGFVVRSARGTKYLMKLDDIDQTPRPTAADAIGSRIYYAAGYTTPCNRVVFFDRAWLRIKPNAKLTTWLGTKRPMVDADIELLLTHASRLADGRYRALASQWLPGDPIGPWTYEKTRPDDPNDVIPHEDRRDVRGIKLLAAWIDNTDSRAQNTLDTWIRADKTTGWVRHAIIDFSDSFGALWTPHDRWRRMGHAYWIDFEMMSADFATLGTRAHPWENAHFGPAGKAFGYWDVEHFAPDHWAMETPNAAFSRLTEHDGAWMARILARFTPAHLERAIRAGRLGSELQESEVLRILMGRRERILRRYLTRLSPLALPEIRAERELCLRDLAVTAGVAGPRNYRASSLPVTVSADNVCIYLPSFAGEMTLEIANADTAPLRVSLTRANGTTTVTKLERPDP